MTHADDAEWEELRKSRYRAETERLQLRNIRKRLLLKKMVCELACEVEDIYGPIAPISNVKTPKPPQPQPPQGKKRARGVGWEWQVVDVNDAIGNQSGKRARRQKPPNSEDSTTDETTALRSIKKEPPTQSSNTVFWMDALAQVHGARWPALQNRYIKPRARTRSRFWGQVTKLLPQKYGASSELRFNVGGKWHVPREDCAEVVDLFALPRKTGKYDSESSGNLSSLSNFSYSDSNDSPDSGDSADSPPPSPRILRSAAVPRTQAGARRSSRRHANRD
ncbi:hypothetical protein M427DRAFT_71658 [Gonapodya prolifera JEL478]|uniref:Uncharacterized protein n=1 Tax=Gonapodya prolifera (strain JEL478) TaxID=1344416 RepID=A0A139A8U0_GONPJ|nr:hypothetical protein M427DRAFT_71658 [Gonapodya prolifera JEL478]|eukprot:KXS13099.1 hypothetical protein M427DRAFT_71658 [Gonapodya prolifera JEL478]